jgi:hypothetical protein
MLAVDRDRRGTGRLQPRVTARNCLPWEQSENGAYPYSHADSAAWKGQPRGRWDRPIAEAE